MDPPANMYRLLNQPQRIGTQAITGAFHIVALPVAEAEANIGSVELRLRKKRLQFWMNLHTLPKDHPFWDIRNSVLRGRRFPSPLYLMARDQSKTLNSPVGPVRGLD